MSDKSPRIRPHETQWGHSAGLTMNELRAVGDRMYHPLNANQQRRIGQARLVEEEPQFLAEAMSDSDNQSESTSGVS